MAGLGSGVLGLALPGCSSVGPALAGATTGASAAPDRSGAASSASTPAPGPGTSLAPSLLREAGPDITRGPTTGTAVALTFHGAGDAGLTTQALQIAAAAGAHLTVFAVGQWLSATPSLGRNIVAAGHDLGNHTWSHQTMTRLTPAQAAQEVSDGARAVADILGGSPGLLFRPSGTPTSTALIRAAALGSGYQRCISYDVDPEDYLDPGSQAVLTRTLAKVTAGSIVSLHLGHQGTIDALPGILQGLRDKGLAAVRLTELLGQAR